MPNARPSKTNAPAAPSGFNPRFIELLIQNPGALLTAIASFLDEMPRTASFAELGVDSALVIDSFRRRLVDEGGADEVATAFVAAVARSALPAPEHAAIEATARDCVLHGLDIDGMDLDAVETIFDAPGAEVWACSPVAWLPPEDMWRGLGRRPALARAVARRYRQAQAGEASRPLLFTHDGLDRGESCLADFDPELISARLEAVAADERRNDPLENALMEAIDAISAISESKGSGPRAAARERAASVCAKTACDILERGGDAKGELALELLKAASALPKGAPARQELARRASSLPLNVDGRRGAVPEERPALWKPSGRGLLCMPPRRVGDGRIFYDAPPFTLADYALAFAGRAGPSGEAEDGGSFSAELDALASDLRELGLADAIAESGSPDLLLRFVELGLELEQSGGSRERRVAAAESAAMLVAMPKEARSAAKGKSAMRI